MYPTRFTKYHADSTNFAKPFSDNDARVDFKGLKRSADCSQGSQMSYNKARRINENNFATRQLNSSQFSKDDYNPDKNYLSSHTLPNKVRRIDEESFFPRQHNSSHYLKDDYNVDRNYFSSYKSFKPGDIIKRNEEKNFDKIGRDFSFSMESSDNLDFCSPSCKTFTHDETIDNSYFSIRPVVEVRNINYNNKNDLISHNKYDDHNQFDSDTEMNRTTYSWSSASRINDSNLGKMDSSYPSWKIDHMRRDSYNRKDITHYFKNKDYGKKDSDFSSSWKCDRMRRDDYNGTDSSFSSSWEIDRMRRDSCNRKDNDETNYFKNKGHVEKDSDFSSSWKLDWMKKNNYGCGIVNDFPTSWKIDEMERDSYSRKDSDVTDYFENKDYGKKDSDFSSSRKIDQIKRDNYDVAGNFKNEDYGSSNSDLKLDRSICLQENVSNKDNFNKFDKNYIQTQQMDQNKTFNNKSDHHNSRNYFSSCSTINNSFGSYRRVPSARKEPKKSVYEIQQNIWSDSFRNSSVSYFNSFSNTSNQDISFENKTVSILDKSDKEQSIWSDSFIKSSNLYIPKTDRKVYTNDRTTVFDNRSFSLDEVRHVDYKRSHDDQLDARNTNERKIIKRTNLDVGQKYDKNSNSQGNKNTLSTDYDNNKNKYVSPSHQTNRFRVPGSDEWKNHDLKNSPQGHSNLEPINNSDSSGRSFMVGRVTSQQENKCRSNNKQSNNNKYDLKKTTGKLGLDSSNEINLGEKKSVKNNSKCDTNKKPDEINISDQSSVSESTTDKCSVAPKENKCNIKTGVSDRSSIQTDKNYKKNSDKPIKQSPAQDNSNSDNNSSSDVGIKADRNTSNRPENDDKEKHSDSSSLDIKKDKKQKPTEEVTSFYDLSGITLNSVKHLLGPFGHKIINVHLIDGDNSLLDSLKIAGAWCKQPVEYTNSSDRNKNIWVAKVGFNHFTIATEVSFSNDSARRNVLTNAVKILRKSYYTLQVKCVYFNNGFIVRRSGEIVKLDINKTLDQKVCKELSTFPGNKKGMNKVKKIIFDYAAKDDIYDLVFSYDFTVKEHKLIKLWAESKKLIVRKAGTNMKKHIYLVKPSNDVWKIVEHLLNGDKRYLENYQLIPPGGDVDINTKKR
ncbi:uncharacterized protein LOC142331827 isoform X2 [Lycorma delicatula]|uniref:uncharacterized protein LOC142331827 isoform X2 n=1 Tax=Lycorma delicatula TaxID=130591 RepID=UPI003F516BA3